MISIFNWISQLDWVRRLLGIDNILYIRRMPHIRTVRAHQLALACAFFCSSAFLLYHYLFATPGIAWGWLLFGISFLFVGSLFGLLLAGIMFLFCIFCFILGLLTILIPDLHVIHNWLNFCCQLAESYVGGYLFGGFFGLFYNDLAYIHTRIFRRDQIKILFTYDPDSPIQIIKSPIAAEVPHKPVYGNARAEDWVYNYDLPSPPAKPITIVFIANPAFQDLKRITSGGIVTGYRNLFSYRDPIVDRQDLFIKTVENALSSLESNEVIGSADIWPRIRIVTIFDKTFAPPPRRKFPYPNHYCLVQSYLAGLRELDPNFGTPGGAAPVVAFDQDVAENLLDPSHMMTSAYQAMITKILGRVHITLPNGLTANQLYKQTDVIYGISAVENYDRPVAHVADWDETGASKIPVGKGVTATLNKGRNTTAGYGHHTSRFLFRHLRRLIWGSTSRTLVHQYSNNDHPGRIAINAYTADQRTFIHEFAHAISSANSAPIVDEYYDRQELRGVNPPPPPANARPPINRQRRTNPGDEIPVRFIEYNDKLYFSDRQHPTARENWRGYFPEKQDVDNECLMDRDTGRNRFDKLLSDFIYDLLMTKSNRP